MSNKSKKNFNNYNKNRMIVKLKKIKTCKMKVFKRLLILY